MDQPQYDYVFKIILVGDSGVGKTSLLLRYVDNIFGVDLRSTIGVDFKLKTMSVKLRNGLTKVLKLQIWDTAGQERHRNLIKGYFRHTHGVIYVFDACKRDSYDNLVEWIKIVQDSECNNDLVPSYVVANKIDLGYEVDIVECQNFCKEHKMDFIGASAYTGENVEKLFESLARKVTENTLNIDTNVDKRNVVIPIDLTNDNQPQTKSCCGGTN